MALRNKIFIPNEIYFITFTILDWRQVFVNDGYTDLVYKWFDYMKINYNNQVCGYVIMPNHLHVLLKITDKSPKISTLIQNAKRFLAYEIVSLLKRDNNLNLLKFFAANARVREGAKHKVFEDNYDSLLISTPKFFLEKLNYIHKNPCVKIWHLADCPENYKYSSAANYLLDKGIYNIYLVEI